jgi:glycosyltransferase involved in cell wall biosynthesis
VDLHVMLELAPEGWSSSLFDVSPRRLPSGVIPAVPVLGPCMPDALGAYWQGARAFNLVVHNRRRSLHPAVWPVSYQAVQAIRRLRPDLVHFDGASLRLASALPALGRTPVVLSLHDPEAHSGEGNWRRAVAEWWPLHHAHRFILHNQAQRELFRAKRHLRPHQIDVIPLGVLDIFTEWIQAPLAPDQRTVLFFGRLSPYKGLDTLYEAACLVAAQVPQARFVVAGRPIGSYRAPATPALPNGGSIHLLSEYVPNAQLAELFQRSTLVVCPYNDATQSGVVLTAYAFRKPVVATRVGGLPEYVLHEETGLLVPPRDPAALAQALVALLAQPERRAAMVERIGQLAASSLSWESIADQTAAVYQQTVGRPDNRSTR